MDIMARNPLRGEKGDLEDSGSEAGQSTSVFAAVTSECRLPLNKVKAMARLDPDVQTVTQDAVFLLAKATEMFIELLAREGALVAVGQRKRKTLMRPDIDQALREGDCKHDCLAFLDGGRVMDMEEASLYGVKNENNS